jgi:hypothetical protein
MKRILLLSMVLATAFLGGCNWLDDSDKTSTRDEIPDDAPVTLTALVNELLLDGNDTAEPTDITTLEIHDDAENQERAFDQHL